MTFFCLLVAFLACTIGRICGMGGGVIIKPVLDALNVGPVAMINFLSGCTVLGMSCWSVGKAVVKKESAVNWAISTPLAIGAAIGGIAGKSAYKAVASLFENPNTPGGVQASILLAATFLTLLYTIKKDGIRTKDVQNKLACVVIGLILGMIGSFLGIGGGPFNMAVLYYFYSMSTKTAAQNSLYVILISQATALMKTILSGAVPSCPILLLFGMIAFGVIGSAVGGFINKKISEKATTRLFEGAMVLVMLICVYNIFRFF